MAETWRRAGFRRHDPLSISSGMNVDEILRALNKEQVDYLLIGGMNFLLRHEPELTYDVDVWVRDDASNLERVNRALRTLDAEWGATDKDWGGVPNDWRWLERQACFCLTTKHGALDVFRDVRGLEGRFAECRTAAVPSKTQQGISYLALADEHMLACQEALPEYEQKAKRVTTLRRVIEQRRKE
jgi:hypothetical protein